VRRRTFITLLGGAAIAWPLAAGAQQTDKLRRIGFVSGAVRPPALERSLYAGLTHGMRQLGYVEGKDFVIEYRFAEGKYERFEDFANELVRLKADAIVLATPAAVRAMQNATDTIPIIMGFSTDPVGNGFVASLARPGGNTTGLASSTDDATPKQLELLAMTIPNLSRVGLLVNPDSPNYLPVLNNAIAAGQKAGMDLVRVEARKPEELDTAFAALKQQNVQALLAVSDGFLLSQRQRITQLALRERLPSMFQQREYPEVGGLMSYGESLFEFYRRAASYLDKIFKGARAGDLPIEQPTRFNLVINRNTADMLGINIPSQVYAFADEVIE
jgi:putative tryptophan/tyrosine transport system substrate-binding protein